MPTRIADRYRVLELLTRGGMGEILVAVDETTGQRVALKRLFERRGKTAVMLFEREYRTLASLQHPSIVQVFDYGIIEETGTPFYTMELLDGQDLTKVAPLPFRDACRYLRDVASSLALLHARHLLHRDVSPRNVRITSEGRCKLLDFGALTSFGLPDEMIGTPPGMPPEAVYGLPLDQRLDLYAVGALGYWLLTGRHAYPTRDPRELPELWASPIPPPSALASDVPDNLDQLILSLLSHDRVERPGSAAEVMDQLSAIAVLPAEDHPDVAGSYLAAPRPIGRKREQERIKGRLADAGKARGASLLVEGLAGMGKTRLIEDATLAGRVAGAVVVRIDAEQHPGPFGVALALADALLRASPTTARKAAENDAAVLAHLVPALAEGPGAVASPGDVAQYPGERRAQIQNAFHHWVMTFARTRQLSLLCDNVHAADQGSLGFLLGLAREVVGTKLFLLMTSRTGEATTDSEASRRLAEASEHIALEPLGAEEMKELAVALFGNVPNVHRFAEWLHEGATGNPMHALELSRYAVAERLVRYQNGSWLLPTDVPRETLSFGDGPTSWALKQLSSEARDAASALSVHDGALTLELCSTLLEGEIEPSGPPPASGRSASQRAGAQPKPAIIVVDELVGAGLLVSHGSEVRFARASVRKHLFEGLLSEKKQRLHRKLGDALLAASNDFDHVIAAGWHLIHGGDETRGADLLAARLGSTHERALVVENDFYSAVPGLEAAYGVYRKQERSLYERAPLLVALIGGGYYVDWRLAQRYGDEGIAVLSEALGLNTAARLRPFLGRRISLIFGIIAAVIRFRRAKVKQGNFRTLFSSFLSCVTFLVGISLLKLEGASARRYADVLAPFRNLNERLAPVAVAQYCDYLALFADDHLAAARSGFQKLVKRIEDPTWYRSMNGESRKLFLGGALYALGVLEAFRDTGDTLKYAKALDEQGFKFYEIVAGRLRIAHHAYRAEMDLMQPHRERLDLHAIQYGSAWQVEIWAPASFIRVYANVGDHSGMKEVRENLLTLSKELPYFLRHVRLCDGTMAMLRGELDSAIAILEELQASGVLSGYPGCHSSVGSLAAAYNQAGLHAKAKALAESFLASMSEEDLDFVAFAQELQLQLALADAALGDHAGAAARLDGLITKYGSSRGPATMALLHQARARVALFAGDSATAVRHMEIMGEHARSTNNPSLISQWKRLKRRSQNAELPNDAQSVLGHTVGNTTNDVSQETHHDAHVTQQSEQTLMDDEGATDFFGETEVDALSTAITDPPDAPHSGSVPPPANS